MRRRILTNAMRAALLVGVLAGCGSTLVTLDPTGPGSNAHARVDGTYSLPRTLLTVLAAAGEAGPQVSLTSRIAADPDAKLAYSLAHLPWFSDNVSVNTSNSLLATVSSTSTDETPAILTSLSELIFTTATGGAVRTRSLEEASALNKGTVITYDPFEPAATARAREALLANNVCVLVGGEVAIGTSLCRTGASPPLPISRVAQSDIFAAVQRFHGLFYRSTLDKPVAVFTRKSARAPWFPLFAGVTPFVDQTSLHRVQLARAPFSTATYTLTYKSGVLETVVIDRPSELAGVAATAAGIVETIFAIPLAGFHQNKQLLDARTQLLQSQSSLIRAERDLVELKLQAATDEGAVFVPVPAATPIARSTVLDVRQGERALLDEIRLRSLTPLCEARVPDERDPCIRYITED